MGHPAQPIRPRFTVQDYLDWPEGERWELIGGEAFDMTPGPGQGHQDAVFGLAKTLDQALRAAQRGGGGGGHSGACALFVAPMDVVLGEDTVVQPDLLVVCDPAKRANPARIQGAPDLVIEVVSPRTASRDHVEKKDLYESAGVPEYLIVDPESRRAYLYRNSPAGFGHPERLEPTSVLHLLGLSLGTLEQVLGWVVPGEQGTTSDRRSV